VLAGDRYAEAVRGDIETARRIGINGVPFFVADGHLGASGAQPPEVLGQLLRQTWEDGHPGPIGAAGAGDTGAEPEDGCGPDAGAI
jgi:predicted DsbA family dithiol-disulfide isomerase